ncbi:MAG: hypothetical protein HFI38_12370 [Lachnospiraceae bacterium]|jgi:CDP-glycerol glycerophosphotransferase (TagB/SpsB family)|nr:hypothetical protein [Lachnospiraceae bacterium]
MEIINRAIERGKHISGNKELDGQTWEDFEKCSERKKVILFGAGASLGCYFERYGDRKSLEGVIDNDPGKQGFSIGEFIPEAFGLRSGEKKISDISLLHAYPPDEIVLLITSTNYYEAIIEQLRRAGVKNYFVLVILEANEKKPPDEGPEESIDLRKTYFAKRCCVQEKVNRKKIFFKAFGDYADHGKYITEALLKKRKDLDLVWSVNDMRAKVPDGVRKIYAGNWKRFIYEMETSGMWILDLPVPPHIIKRPGQLYIQTKHWASITLKRFYLDASAFQTEPEKKKIWEREKDWIDHIITGSDFDTISCRRGFGFEGKVLQYGSPRSDALFSGEKNRKKVYEYFALDKVKKALLYAPTYRFDRAQGKKIHESRNIELDFERLHTVLKRRFGGGWYLLVRLHPSVAHAFETVEKPDFVVDVSLYDDSQELVSASDILVSDYSSIMFEAAFVDKPVFLYATDLQEYITKEYELLIPYRELPFAVAESDEELERNILRWDPDLYRSRLESFLRKYGVCEDGHASERTAAFIINWIEEGGIE